MTDQQGGLTETFSGDVLKEAASLTEQIVQTTEQRSHVSGITLDHPWSNDLDDGFWVEHDSQGGYRLQISIVDVASFIHSDLTPLLEREASERIATLYLARDVVLPMLPPLLSEDKLSLLEGQLRPTITLTIPLDAQLRPGQILIEPTSFINRKRLTYSEADAEMESVQTEIGTQLHLAYMLAQALFLQRQHREALALYDLALGWATTEEGQLRPLQVEERYNTHLIPAEFMILANQCFASFLAQHDIPAFYRNHRARTIAPERSLLLQQMETALAHPEQQSFQQIRATTDLVLERASYAPTVLGHFGLNLPVYIHLTSPLRRYADLVNQRILLAVLSEEASSFSKETLEAKAAVINREEQARKTAKKSQFLSAYDTELQQSIEQSEEGDEATRLIALDTRRFHSLLRIAAQSQALSPALEKEILRRLEQHMLKANDLFTLLFRFPTTGGEQWQHLQEALLRWLPQQPDFAVNILLMGEQILGWVASFPEEAEYPDTPGHFEAIVCVDIIGRSYCSTPQRALRKALARQLACVDLLTKIAGFEDLLTSSKPAAVLQTASVSPETEIGVQSSPNTSDANIIGYLNEMQQKREIRSVDYHFQSPESAQHLIFLCFCTITTNEGHCIEGSGSEKTKRVAKEAAALEALKAWISEMEQEETSDAT